MEEHPPLFSQEELDGLPESPAETHQNIVSFPGVQQQEANTQPLVPVFNPTETVSHPAPVNTEPTLIDMATRYKEMIGVWPDDEMTKEQLAQATKDADAAEQEFKRLRDLEIAERQQENDELYKRWKK